MPGAGKGTLAGVALGAALGLGAGYVLFGGGRTDPALGIAGAPAAPPAAAPAPEPAPPPEPIRAPAGGFATLGDALAAVPRPEAATGVGAIDVVVALADGTPLDAVLVRATPTAARVDDATRPGGAAPADEPIDARVRRLVREAETERNGRREAASGADGVARLTGLADGAHRIAAWREGYDIAGDGSEQTARPGDTVRLRASPMVDVPVRVLAPDGSPPPEARIDVQGGGQRGTAVQPWSPADPRVRLAPGAYRLRARSLRGADGEADQRSAEVPVTAAAGATPAPVELRLEVRRGIRGRVRAGGRQLPDWLRLLALRLAAGEAPDPDRLAGEGGSRFVSGRSGTFALLDLDPGTWLIGVAPQDGAVLAHAVVEVADGIVTRDIELPAPDPGAGIRVRVLDDAGAPVPSPQFSLRVERDGSSHSGDTSATLGADGLWWLARPGADATKVELTVTSEHHGTRTLPVPEDPTAVVEVRFGPPATLAVTVTGYAGSPVVGRLVLTLEPRVDVEGEDGGEDHTRLWQTLVMHRHTGKRLSSEGLQTLGPTEAGQYVLSCWFAPRGENQWTFLPVARRELTLAPGANAATLSAPTLHRVTVACDALAAGTEVRLSPSDRSMGQLEAKLDDTHRAVFDDVPAGEYDAAAWGGDLVYAATVRVPGAGLVTLEGRPNDCYGVSIEDEAGPMAKAGFRDEDHIIGVDGQEFANAKQMSFAMAAAKGKERVAFLVLRGAERLTITIAPAVLFDGDPGGSIYETARPR